MRQEGVAESMRKFKDAARWTRRRMSSACYREALKDHWRSEDEALALFLRAKTLYVEHGFYAKQGFVTE
jgi:hypothetical protein